MTAPRKIVAGAADATLSSDRHSQSKARSLAAYPLVSAFLFSVIGLSHPVAFIGAVICLAAFVVESDVRALDAHFYFGNSGNVKERQ